MVRAGNFKVWAVMIAAMVAAVIVLLWWKAEPAQSATALPLGFTDSLVAQVNHPTSMAIAPDGRLLVAQKNTNNVGKVRVIKNGQLLSKPFLKVTTDTADDRGLLGITLDPNFSQNHYVYIFYTAMSPTVHNRVSRFTANGDVAVAGSEKPILNLSPLVSGVSGHYGGSLRFGPDGKLYVGVGDYHTPTDAQSLAPSNTNILNGKILRINSDGTIPSGPSGNPFYGGATPADDAIWALGVRQPYSLDVLSGTSPKMFLNDVGEDLWEEIDAVSSGANYGWGFPKSPPYYEGFVASPDPALQNYQNPEFSYTHGTTADTGCAITGGAFYDPATVRFPAQYQGEYFYADFCSGWIRSFDPATRQSAGFASGLVKPVDLEVGDNGSLYYLSWQANSVPASVHEIKYK